MKHSLLFLLIFFTLASCQDSSQSLLGSDKSQAQTRSYQSRSFETGNKDFVIRGVISTMQDLGFIIEKADEKFGIVSGTSFKNNSQITVSIKVVSPNRTVVRVNAQAGLREIESQIPYSNFFNSLSQSLFLEANLTD